MNLLIDTNVILDLLACRTPWVQDAASLFSFFVSGAHNGFISASSFSDLYYLLKKQTKNTDTTEKALLGLLELISVLDVSGEDCKKAFLLPMPDYEDALLAQCAKRHHMDRIITRNIKDFINSPVPPLTPAEANAVL
jgi:predicted nucleic acid-binding protein